MTDIQKEAFTNAFGALYYAQKLIEAAVEGKPVKFSDLEYYFGFVDAVLGAVRRRGSLIEVAFDELANVETDDIEAEFLHEPD